MITPRSITTTSLQKAFRSRRAILLLVLLAALATLHCATATPAPAPGAATPDTTATIVKIGIVGDQTASTDLQGSYRVLEQGVEALRGRSLDAVLHVGDLVESSDEPDQIRADFAEATGILDRLEVPWYLTAGDHDVNPPKFVPNSPDRSREKLFQGLYAERNPRVEEHLYYSFDIGGFHFVALYSQQSLHSDPRWGNVFLARIQEDQLDWLAEDLETHRYAQAVVVFLHQPLWYDWRGWRPVHELLREYPVAAVVAGHFHYNQLEGRTDGIEYLVVGATGGKTKEGSPNAGDTQLVSVLTLSGPGPDGLEVELVPLSGDQPMAFSPRRDMDLVQALDVQLGNFFDFAGKNPVFVRDGKLLADCDSGEPASIQIDQIGNPTQLPLDLEIAFTASPPTVSLADPSFTLGMCRETLSPTECVLEPTVRTTISNTSNVQIDGNCPCGTPWPGSTPLWQSGLTASRQDPAPGTTLSFTVHTTFTGTTGQPFSLTREVATEIAACP